ncbi:hypothetical protein FVE85_3411 [Porphyridium purpureum]|uniref:Protein N-lysine methyltransferase METTL21A n=1 Tax=Porphyridium purpureum TaxID=35688 RepID=A0A5J4YW68_PORPP|nr:hypothetical protein FVE85_3411 [Porphyridium purpureum]|eukprot:POR5232..scf227_4
MERRGGEEEDAEVEGAEVCVLGVRVAVRTDAALLECGKVWDANWALAEVLEQRVLRAAAVRQRCVLELGAGTGVMSIALAERGCLVLCTDQTHVLPLIRANVARNGYSPDAAQRTVGDELAASSSEPLLFVKHGADSENKKVVIGALDWNERSYGALDALRTALHGTANAIPFDAVVCGETLYWPGLSILDPDPLDGLRELLLFLLCTGRARSAILSFVSRNPSREARFFNSLHELGSDRLAEVQVNYGDAAHVHVLAHQPAGAKLHESALIPQDCVIVAEVGIESSSAGGASS